MSQIDPPPRKLTPALTTLIQATLTAGDDDLPSSPLDWIAAQAGVRKATVQRWVKRAAAVRRGGSTGPIADRWVGFVDALDALVSKCANRHIVSIANIARESSPKQQLDARLALLTRLDKHEARLDACDEVEERDNSIAHVPQEILDELSDIEIEALDDAQNALAAAVERVERILAAASERLES
jgi:hypothetical protein